MSRHPGASHKSISSADQSTSEKAARCACKMSPYSRLTGLRVWIFLEWITSRRLGVALSKVRYDFRSRTRSALRCDAYSVLPTFGSLNLSLHTTACHLTR